MLVRPVETLDVHNVRSLLNDLTEMLAAIAAWP